MATKLLLPPYNWTFTHEKHPNDSANDEIKIIDASAVSMNHPQGPLVVATLNVRAYAPHVEYSIQEARLIAAAVKTLAFIDDLAKSNPGWLGRSVLQDYAIYNEAMMELPRAIAKANGSR